MVISNFQTTRIEYDNDESLLKVATLLAESLQASTIASVKIQGWSVLLTICPQHTELFDREDQGLLFIHLGELLERYFGAYDWVVELTMGGEMIRLTSGES
jgi:hypothetical protein